MAACGYYSVIIELTLENLNRRSRHWKLKPEEEMEM